MERDCGLNYGEGISYGNEVHVQGAVVDSGRCNRRDRG